MRMKTFKIITLLVVFITSMLPAGPSHVMAADEYLARDSIYSMSDPNVNRATSTHFQIIWGKNDQTGTVNDAFIQGNLKNLEGQWTTYVTDMGYKEPGVSIKPANQSKKYKTNVYVTRTGLSKHAEGWGFMSNDSDGFAYIIVDPVAMRVDVPSWVIPHELGHVITYHQASWVDSTITGAWWEAVADWLREQYLTSPNYQYNGKIYSPDTNFFDPMYMNGSLCSPHGRTYYDAWPILQYIAENPDNYPYYGRDFMRDMMQKAKMHEYPYDTIIRLAPGVSIKDTLGNYAKRMVTQDFQQKTVYRKRFNQLIATDSNKQMVYTQLVKVNDKSDWWRVPSERAPQQTGFNIIPLTPNGTGNGRTVKVNFNGLIDSSRGTDWRACIVVQDDSGNTRYSTLWNKGENSITLSNTENKVFLVVVATPDKLIPLDAFADETKSPFMSAPEKQKMPYEVQITGAVPYEAVNSITGITGSKHPNGGGFVQNTAKVDSTAYVGPNAAVLGSAKVQGKARIEDYAVVKGNAVVSGNAIVSGHAIIKDSAIVKDNAKIRDFAVMMGNAEASGNARVLESATVKEKRKITDNGVAKGMAIAAGEASITGEGMVDGDYIDSTNITKGVAFGWTRGQDYASSRPYTPSLYAGYEFGTSSSVFARDKYGVTHGIIRGNPLWSASSEGHSGILQLNGDNQYVVLENSVSDLKDIEIRATVRWDGGTANQRLFNFGSSQDKYMYLTPSDENGKVKFEIRNGNNVKTMVADASLPVGSWVDLRLVLTGDTGILYINNTPAAVQNDININPEDLNAPNVNSQSNSNYIGRGILPEQPLFKGAVDSFHIYFKPVDSVIPSVSAKPTSTPTPTPKGHTISGYVSQDFASSLASIKSGFKVEILGTGLSSATDNNGYFSLTNVPANASGYTVRISKAGYLYRDIGNVKIDSSDISFGSTGSPVILWAGDINSDNTINMADVIEMAKSFNATSGEVKFIANCDINKDNTVNMADIVIIAKNFPRIQGVIL
ncbi:DUF6055 domain-containing protein [Pseudobacteroides cellulosolvens]|uniref:Dockerin domain-containing protein n=1 Tax=Pseudobacteroides cellulosolvens ATCC 35603 = DSM 2933 TaxID=398512 RepID=A0A0L6JIC0_9FIRM|nr:DUF6055 domain-containing protein [Pseudobacteroides cellulosolvens]KNY25606.1 hypothetical protein Bccel_0866 [Pseudobacteroides cellulosolvens ATCC 35603 = DSM 2933]